ncbi:RHS repeat-associated core domain-containing protein [Cytophagaceae bacterium ABcell3]|nr:RHS repeat-associated core domain-containing protein [Cytophagaceae bacterium ABcell3]
MQKQDGSYKSTTYIDGIFEHTRESISAAAYAIPNLEIGQWTIGVYDQGTAIPDLEIGQWIIGQYGGSTTEQNTLHIMDDQSRIATIRLGDAMGDITPAIKYNLEDHLGSSSIQLDTNGTLVNSEEYYPFGETSFGSYGKKRYRFCGKEKDEESGLYYYGMRYYNAWTCRFVSVDPLAGKTKNFSPYAYADCNPIMKNDPTGGKAENAGGGGGDGGGGGEKASDETGASREGREIVKVNGVSYETWKGKDGTIYAQKVEDVETGKGHSKVPVNKVANKAEREAIQSHWDSEFSKAENTEVEIDCAELIEENSSKSILDVLVDSEEEALGAKLGNSTSLGGDVKETVVEGVNKTAEFVSEDLKVKDADAPLLGLGIYLDRKGDQLNKKYSKPIKEGKYPKKDGTMGDANDMASRKPKRQSQAYRKAVAGDKLAKVFKALGPVIGIAQIMSDYNLWRKGEMSDARFVFKLTVFAGSLHPATKGLSMLLDIIDFLIVDNMDFIQDTFDDVVNWWNSW